MVGVLRAGRDAGGGTPQAGGHGRRGIRPAGGIGGGISRALLRPARVRRSTSAYRGSGAGMTFFLVGSIIKIVVVFTVIMVGVALLTLAERRICAWMQDRLGPNRVGPQGLLQPAADGLKNLVKEETLPAQADKVLFMLAPAMSFIPALLTFAVIPFAAPLPTPWGAVDMVVANLPVGFLYILAFGSLGVYGIVLAGWSSHNKYSLPGGFRASAQKNSYEIPLGLNTPPVLLPLDDAQDPGDARDVFGEGDLLPVPVHLGALDLAALPLRSTDGPRMESHAAPRACLPHRDRDRDLVPARPARLAVRHPFRPRLVRAEPAA